MPDSSCVGHRAGDREGGSMFGLLFVDVVCWLDEVKVEDVFSSLKFVTATWFYFYKREKNFLLITNIVVFFSKLQKRSISSAKNVRFHCV